MNNCIKEAIKETISNIAEKDEFKRRFEVYLENYFDGNAIEDDLQHLIRLIDISESETIEVDQ